MDPQLLSLLQLLAYAGQSPETLQGVATQKAPQPNGEGDPGGNAPSFSPSVTGIGAMSPSQAVGAFGAGMGRGGLMGRAGEAMGLNGQLTGTIGKMGLQGLGIAGGFPTAVLGLLNSLFGGLHGLADAAQRSVGPRGQSTTLSDALRSLGLRVGADDPDGGGPSSTPGTTTGAPSFSTDFGISQGLGLPGIGPGYGLSDPNGPALSAVFGDAAPGFMGDPTGSDNGDGPSGDSGDGSGVGAYYHGGAVRGPAGRDKVPARLTRGEFVMDRNATQQFGPLLELLNRIR